MSKSAVVPMRSRDIGAFSGCLDHVWLKTSEAAKLLGCSSAKVRVLVKRGLLKPDARGRGNALAFRYSTVARRAMQAANDTCSAASQSMEISEGPTDPLPRTLTKTESRALCEHCPLRTVVGATERDR